MDIYSLITEIQTQTHALSNKAVTISAALELLDTDNNNPSLDKYINIIEQNLNEIGKLVDQIDSICDNQISKA